MQIPRLRCATLGMTSVGRLHGAVVIAAHANIDQRELRRLTFLFNANDVLIVLGTGFELGGRAASFVVFVAGKFVLRSVLVHIANDNIVGFMGGTTFKNFLAVLLQFLAIKIEHFLRRIVGLVFNGDNFQPENRCIDDDV